MNKLRWLAILMGITIIGITGFQGYWLKNNYDREEERVELATNAAFRQTILRLQSAKLRFDQVDIQFREGPQQTGKMPAGEAAVTRPRRPPVRTTFEEYTERTEKSGPIRITELLQERMLQADTGQKLIILSGNDSTLRNSERSRILQNKVKSISIVSSGDSALTSTMLEKISRSLPDPGKGQVRLRLGKHDSIAVDSVVAPNGKARGTHRPNLITTRTTKNETGDVFRFLYSLDSISIRDSIKLTELTAAYASRLREDGMNLSFSIARIDSTIVDSLASNEVTLGFVQPITYRLSLDNKAEYIFGQLKLPILFSIFLVGLTIASLILLYRNLVRQQRMSELKNQFISNITHELKTPIATVSVAIEALQNFSVMNDPGRTREYLDISQHELQRLGLLVDKVLKLSMFEKKEMELKKEPFDVRRLVEEVINSMRIQFEKMQAQVKFITEGENFTMDADKLHITSVVYNLLDNALKYSKQSPVIEVKLVSRQDYIELTVADNGIGIQSAYKDRIFDKFFRVPTGDTHNIKGYGLGLSYVAEVIRRHRGEVYAESEFGRGSRFIAKVPYA